ncbi:FAD-binding oxidoreductase [Acetonema longum]|uniref:Glycolate oxidase subunit n=1 Tax=Acetonema longum DSM 6540 TaxID=1009370 RepID=F7NMX2_9FIRM|nr:FAD-binding oxidoreductase [Acetonema longum]EGO62616.1 glycolate oxidase subunit [Acetonema longum DSM 6540]
MSEKKPAPQQQNLAGICPVIKGSEAPEIVLDGKIPQYVAYPSSDKEAAQILSLAARTKTPLAVIGGASKFNAGTPLTDLEWALSTVNLNQEPVIKADDLIVQVKAGVALAELQNLLSRHNLFLPVDPGTAKATVGGMLAQGGGGSHRLKYGLVRDLVLGMTLALTDGKVYKFGGQTVKNVTGYDVGKLFIGSKGTLGVITEAYLRVYPVPPASEVLLGVARGLDAVWKAAKAMEEIEPAVVEIYDAPLAKRLYNLGSQGNVRYGILVKYAGPGPAVDKQYAETLAVFNQYGISLSKADVNDAEIWEKREVMNTLDAFTPDLIGVKIAVPRVKTRQMAEGLEAAAGQFGIEQLAMHMPAVGICQVWFTGKQWLEFMRALEGTARGLGGLVQLKTGDLSVRREFRIDSAQILDSQIKHFFDPEGVLNAGKCV